MENNNYISEKDFHGNDKNRLVDSIHLENYGTYLNEWKAITNYKLLDFKYIDEQFNDGSYDCYDENLEYLGEGISDAYLMTFKTGEYFEDSDTEILEALIKGEKKNNSYIIYFGKIDDLKKIARFDIAVPNQSSVFNYYHSIAADDNVSNESEFVELLHKQYKDKADNNQFIEYQLSKGKIRCFDSGSQTNSGEKIFFQTTENYNQNASKKWYGISCITEEQIWNEYFDSKGYHFGRIFFKDKNEGDKFLESLANLATEERWSFNDDNSDKTILRNYISNTLERLHTMNQNKSNEPYKLYFKEIKNKVFFNSGLLDKNFEEIFICVDKKQEEVPILGKKTVYENPHAYSDGDSKARGILKHGEKLSIAKYFNDTKEVIFDCSETNIYLDYDHIFQDGLSRDRIPKYRDEYQKVKEDPIKFQELQEKVKNDFKIAIDRAVMLAERNYKLAVPQYRSVKNKIQFLLPIYLGEGEEAKTPQCALVLEYYNTDDIVAPYYEGSTILTLDMAYNNARLIAKPDAYWLDDVSRSSKEEID